MTGDTGAQPPDDRRGNIEAHGTANATEGWLDRLCLWGCGVAITGMIASIGVIELRTQRSMRFGVRVAENRAVRANELYTPNHPLVRRGIEALSEVATSSLHSWLVLAIADGDDVVERVGFYYAANSAGRLLGTLLSGALFGAFTNGSDGLIACITASLALVGLATLCTAPVRVAQ